MQIGDGAPGQPALGIGTSAKQMEWFQAQGLNFPRSAVPNGCGVWALYCPPRQDVYGPGEAIVNGGVGAALRSHSAGILALRPDKIGVSSAYNAGGDRENIRRG